MWHIYVFIYNKYLYIKITLGWGKGSSWSLHIICSLPWLQSLEGRDLVFLVSPPPSTSCWFCFSGEPWLIYYLKAISLNLEHSRGCQEIADNSPVVLLPFPSRPECQGHWEWEDKSDIPLERLLGRSSGLPSSPTAHGVHAAQGPLRAVWSPQERLWAGSRVTLTGRWIFGTHCSIEWKLRYATASKASGISTRASFHHNST